MTALDYVCTTGELEVAQWLVEHGADPSQRSDYNNTTLHYAANYGQSDVVKWLAPIMNINELASPGHEGASPQAKAIKRGYPGTATIIENEFVARRQAAWVAAGVASRTPSSSSARCIAGHWTMVNTEGHEFKYIWEHTAGSPGLRGKQVMGSSGVTIPVYGTIDREGRVVWVCDGKRSPPVKCEAVLDAGNGSVHSGEYWTLDSKGNKTTRVGAFTGVRTQAAGDTLHRSDMIW